MACEFEEEDGDIAPAKSPVSARDAPEVSEEEHGTSLTLESRNLQNSERRTSFILMVILKVR